MYALIGHPLGHSLSPFIHRKLFRLSGKDCGYGLCDIRHEGFDSEIENVICSHDGLNVTIPYKTKVIPFLDELDETAARYSAVNCIRNDNGRTIGYNTDCVGFLRSVPEKALSGRFLLLGCGGAGRMMAVEAAIHGADITVGIRESSRVKADALMLEINKKYPGVNIRTVLLDRIEGHYDLLANSTPVGMYPNTEDCPVSEEVIEGCDFVFDAVYNPRKTLLVETAEKMGKKAAGGMSMLVLQAVKAHEIWYGGKFSKKSIENIIDMASEELEDFGR